MGKAGDGKKIKDKKDTQKVKSPRTRTRQKAPAKGDGPLKRSFASSNKDDRGPEGVSDGVPAVSKAQQSGFITYLRCCITGKDTSAADQASIMLEDYKKMSPTAKKSLISAFLPEWCTAKQGFKASMNNN